MKDPRTAGTAVVPNFSSFGGEHCETSAVAKVLEHGGVRYSEALLFGLAGGLGFVYWKTKRMPTPFIGGRNGKFPDFVHVLGARLGHHVRVVKTRSIVKAERLLRLKLIAGTPLVCYGDIHYLPYFQTRRHFGGHAFVVYGIDDEQEIVFISDRSSRPRTVTLDELRRARNSGEQPFAPGNAYLEIEPRHDGRLDSEAVRDAIAHCREAMTRPPISNFGLPGLKKLSSLADRWLTTLAVDKLVDTLVESYINLELAGTGGCAFRRLYREFIQEAQGHLGLDLGGPLSCLDGAIERWQDFIDALLPEASQSLGAIRNELHAKDGLFLNGTMQELAQGADHAPRIDDLRRTAAEELRRNKDVLGVLPQRACEVYESEVRLFGALDAT